MITYKGHRIECAAGGYALTLRGEFLWSHSLNVLFQEVDNYE